MEIEMALRNNFGTGWNGSMNRSAGKIVGKADENGRVVKTPRGWVAQLKGAIDSMPKASEDDAVKQLVRMKKIRDFVYNDNEPRFMQLKAAGL